MTATIFAAFANIGTPATGLSATIRIRRADTQALVVTDSAMTEQGDGAYSFVFAPVDGIDYSIRSDGGVTLADSDRYVFGSLSGTAEAREGEIAEILDVLINRLEWDFTVTPARLNQYDRAGVAVVRFWEMGTNAGEKVVTHLGVQTKRGVPQ